MTTPDLSETQHGGRDMAPNPSDKPPLLRLPVDILLLITDELPLHSRFYFSQTCGDVRSILNQEWPGPVSRDERMNFFTEMAYLRPDRLVCLRCCKLHKVTLQGTPASPHFKPSTCPYTRRCLYDRSRGYALNQSHVQLALKYARLGGHEKFLKGLMAPRRFGVNNLLAMPFAITYAKVPRIIDGRFLLKTTIDYTGDYISGRDLMLHAAYERGGGHAMLCRHTNVWQELQRLHLDPDVSDHEMDERIAERVRISEEGLRNSCRMCRADILMQFGPERCRFRSWQDFGSETESGIAMNDPSLQRYLWKAEELEHLQQPEIPHVAGAIEALWKPEPSGSKKEVPCS